MPANHVWKPIALIVLGACAHNPGRATDLMEVLAQAKESVVYPLPAMEDTIRQYAYTEGAEANRNYQRYRPRVQAQRAAIEAISSVSADEASRLYFDWYRRAEAIVRLEDQSNSDHLRAEREAHQRYCSVVRDPAVCHR
jgi:hypothetical protein